jgi:hypothetical protein
MYFGVKIRIESAIAFDPYYTIRCDTFLIWPCKLQIPHLKIIWLIENQHKEFQANKISGDYALRDFHLPGVDGTSYGEV